MLKLTGKEKHTPYAAIFFNKAKFDLNDYLAHILPFFKKIVLYTYVDQTSVLWGEKVCSV